MRKGMEQKAIKEESGEKDNGTVGYVEPPRTRSKASCKDRCKTPDSPEGARQAAAPLSPTQSSPANGTSSPINHGSSDSLTPPLPPSTALSVNLETTQHYTHGSYNNIARPLVKVKKFLSTLVQFGNDINGDIGERVRSLVLNLVSSNLSIEEFHHSLQDVTNFPLRPFVLPFLRTHLPLLQREIHGLARTNKQSPLQYVRSHDHVVLDPSNTHSPSELSEIFMSNDGVSMAATGIKRRASDSIYENGLLNGQHHETTSQDNPSSNKRQTLSTHQNPFLLSHQSLLLPSSNFQSSHFLDYSNQHVQQPRFEDNNNVTVTTRVDEEWRNIHVMLNCILSMVEKTKRALTILQQRNSQDLTNDWLRKQDVSVDLKKAANEIMLQAVRQTEDRVAEVRRRAEDAVNDVKRQAVIELQKAVAAAETKANELVAAERAKMEKLLVEARSKHSEEVSENDSAASQPAPSQQNSCWNCGRKAHETCSGCSVARYCGPFCQHKDWENHHQICSKDKGRPLRASPTSATAPSPLLVQEPAVGKFKK